MSVFKPLALSCAALVLGCGLASAQVGPDGKIDTDTARLRWLDKITGRMSDIEAPVGQTVRFGNLEIIVRSCKKNPPEDKPENAAFLDVWEIKEAGPAADVFRGWMFASSPALSAMEHAVYDIWVLECVSGDTPSQ